MKLIKNFFIPAFLLCITSAFAQKGKEGSIIITTANTIVNEYAVLTANASTGDFSVTVDNSVMNTNNRFTGPLTSGDLVMMIQMQGATITNTNDSTWGTINKYNNCGTYEFFEVSSVPNATTINLNCSIQHNYTASGKVQLVRVPRYNSLTINSPGILTADAWDGKKGGALIVEVLTGTTINTGGSMNVTGKGFRGGVAHNAGAFGVTAFASAASGAEKGEGIAGYETDYTAFGGQYERGAPANGGGGGNGHNSGGGGGANAGSLSSWTGNGNPDLSTPAWASGWNLEYAGFASSTSSGGGRGGYTYLINNQDPLTVGPGNGSWGGDSRRNVGGKGGRPLDYSTGKLFFAGGGGSGEENDGVGTGGGNAGGLIYVLGYDVISGQGDIIANGASVGNTTGGGYDGCGGGGGGGTIILNAVGTISGITANANGGNGGNQISTQAEGPGGGGGGGYIAISNGSITRFATGGANGVTNYSGLTTFPSNGATMGGSGMPTETINGIPVSTLPINTSPDVAVCTGASTNLLATAAGGTYSWNPSAGLSSTTISNPVATPQHSTTYTVVVTNAGCTGSAVTTVTVNPYPTPAISGNNSICFQANTTLTATGGGTYLWSNGETTASVTVSPNSSISYSVTVTKDGCSGSTFDSVTVNPTPQTLAGTDQHIYQGQSASLSGSGIGNYSWTPSTALSCTNCPNPTAAPQQTTTYYLTITNASGCKEMDSVKVIVDANCGEVFVPNAFSPNGDTYNDVFYARNPCVKEMSFNVYDRWGNKVFNSEDPQHGWDGTFNGKKMDPGVFVYYLSVKLYDGQEVTKKGNVSLIR